MDKDTVKGIVTFELESSCPEGVDVERCSEGIAEKLGDDFAPRYSRVRNVVLDGLQTLEACLVDAEMDQLAEEIAERLCSGSELEEEESEFLSEIDDEDGEGE